MSTESPTVLEQITCTLIRVNKMLQSVETGSPVPSIVLLIEVETEINSSVGQIAAQTELLVRQLLRRIEESQKGY